MGNCQAADASMVIIQHPSGRVQRLYWPISAREVMRSNPGHYVGLVTISQQLDEKKHNHGGIRFTQVKLLRAKDTLIIGQVYRLITSQEVMDALWAKNHTRAKKNQIDLERKEQIGNEACRLQGRVDRRKAEPENSIQGAKQERNRHRPTGSSARFQWRPSLQSISEAAI